MRNKKDQENGELGDQYLVVLIACRPEKGINLKLACDLSLHMHSIYSLFKVPHNILCSVPNFCSTMAAHQGLKFSHPFKRRLNFKDECRIFILILLLSFSSRKSARRCFKQHTIDRLSGTILPTENETLGSHSLT